MADNQSYRRGQALGFTVAELFTLLLFLILLILASVEEHEKSAVRSDQEKLAQVQKELEGERKNTTALAETNKRLREYFGVSDNFGDDFRDLVPDKDGLSNRRREVVLREKAAAADEIHRLLDSASSTKNTEERERLYDSTSLPTRVKSCLDENQRLRGQVANVEKRYGGSGTEFPSCWLTPNGSTEFVLDVELLSSPDGGQLVIHDSQVPGHEEEKTRLFRGVQFDQPMTDSDFVDETRSFYEFGPKQRPECRFFVRVNDRTAAQDKSTFKGLLLTVQNNFYTAWREGD